MSGKSREFHPDAAIDIRLLELASRGILAILESHFYTPLRLPFPQPHITFSERDANGVAASVTGTSPHMTEPAHTSSLAAVNSKIIAEGEVLPAVQIKDGTRMRTGTVATMLHNIGLYNAGKRDQVERELEAAIPTLLKVGPLAFSRRMRGSPAITRTGGLLVSVQRRGWTRRKY